MDVDSLRNQITTLEQAIQDRDRIIMNNQQTIKNQMDLINSLTDQGMGIAGSLIMILLMLIIAYFGTVGFLYYRDLKSGAYVPTIRWDPRLWNNNTDIPCATSFSKDTSGNCTIQQVSS